MLIAFAMYTVGSFVTTMEKYQWFKAGSGEELWIKAGVLILGSIIGMVGGAIGRKIGGILLIASAVMMLFAHVIFVILPSTLLGIAGAMAFREKKEVKSEV
jgi:uncharacterized membrane protein YoaK (UPF0700 family)